MGKSCNDLILSFVVSLQYRTNFGNWVVYCEQQQNYLILLFITLPYCGTPYSVFGLPNNNAMTHQTGVRFPVTSPIAAGFVLI